MAKAIRKEGRFSTVPPYSTDGPTRRAEGEGALVLPCRVANARLQYGMLPSRPAVEVRPFGPLDGTAVGLIRPRIDPVPSPPLTTRPATPRRRKGGGGHRQGREGRVEVEVDVLKPLEADMVEEPTIPDASFLLRGELTHQPAQFKAP